TSSAYRFGSFPLSQSQVATPADAIPSTPAPMATYCFTCTLLFASSAAFLHATAPFAVQLSQAALAAGLLAISGGLVCGPVTTAPCSHACRGLNSSLYWLEADAFITTAVVMPATATPVAIHAPTRIFPYLSL